MKFLASLAAVAATVATTAFADDVNAVHTLQPRQSSSKLKGTLPIVTVKGNAFYAGKERFYIRGVAYQPGGAADAADPILDTKTLARDIKLFKRLGINTIRVYTVDNSKSHDEGMKMLDDAGIYLALDVNTPKFSINREKPKLSYNEKYLQSVFATAEEFTPYKGTLLLISGNEVINAPNSTGTAPTVKAVTRDLKNFIANRGMRPVPVGYSSADVSENIEQQLKYFSCGEGEQARADFFAFNDYSWCDPSSFQKSGWDVKTKTYGGYNVPIFLSEFGCNKNTRQWEELSALYSKKMTGVYSGGLAYEFTVEDNGYGLVEKSGAGVEPNGDFRRLEKAFKQYKPPSGDGGASTKGKIPDCPPHSKTWNVKDKLIPAPPSGIQKYMTGGAGKGPGLAKSAGTSQGGGGTSSDEMIEMTGAAASGSPASVDEDGSGTSGGSQASGGAAASTYGMGSPAGLVAVVLAAMVSATFGAGMLI
ncbi:MAG: hypothetical protein M1831_001573 [Alyxoria varia]|nr:MAG: hypothetical protein M1831_001573 [Alyxoria varia]